MNCDYWDGMAEDYEAAILSVFDHDTHGLVAARIADAGRNHAGGRAADLGCGVGKFTVLLARTFAQVEACDFSGRSLARARRQCGGKTNITFRQFDLASDPVPFVPVDFVLCVNVLIMPSLDQRLRAWRAVTNQVRHDGTLLLVVPALESVQFENFRVVDARLRDGETCAEAVRPGGLSSGTVRELQQGVHNLDGVSTKHYLGVELEQMLADHEFELLELIRLEYERPVPARSAGPWDWLVTARRR